MITDIYVVDGEGLNIVTLQCNIWSLAGRKEGIFSLKNKEIKQFAAQSKSKKRKSADRRKIGIPVYWLVECTHHYAFGKNFWINSN